MSLPSPPLTTERLGRLTVRAIARSVSVDYSSNCFYTTKNWHCYELQDTGVYGNGGVALGRRVCGTTACATTRSGSHRPTRSASACNAAVPHPGTRCRRRRLLPSQLLHHDPTRLFQLRCRRAKRLPPRESTTVWHRVVDAEYAHRNVHRRCRQHTRWCLQLHHPTPNWLQH